MKNESIKILQKNKKPILEQWMKNQMSNEGLRQDLIDNEDLREQSEEFLNTFVDSLNDNSIDNADSRDFDRVEQILSSISVSRAKQGFSPRETSVYIFSFKDAILQILAKEIKDPSELYNFQYKNQQADRQLQYFYF